MVSSIKLLGITLPFGPGDDCDSELLLLFELLFYHEKEIRRSAI